MKKLTRVGAKTRGLEARFMDFEHANAALARAQPTAQVFTRELRCTGRICDHGSRALSSGACDIGGSIGLALNDHRVLAGVTASGLTGVTPTFQAF